VGSGTSDGLDELLNRSLKQVGSWKVHSMGYVLHVTRRGRAHEVSEMVGRGS
jgi:hypothetical protein